MQRDPLRSAGPEATVSEGSLERPSSPLSLDRDDLESQLALTLAERWKFVYGRVREHGLLTGDARESESLHRVQTAARSRGGVWIITGNSLALTDVFPPVVSVCPPT